MENSEENAKEGATSDPQGADGQTSEDAEAAENAAENESTSAAVEQSTPDTKGEQASS